MCGNEIFIQIKKQTLASLKKEVTMSDLLIDDEKNPRFDKQRNRVKNLRSRNSARYIGLSKMNELHFECDSETSGNVYEQVIRLDELKTMMTYITRDKYMSEDEAIEAAITEGDVSIKCNCGAWRWFGFEYINSELDSIYGAKQGRFPKIRNKDLKGTICKHLNLILSDMGKFMPDIIEDVKLAYADLREKWRNWKKAQRDRKKQDSVKDVEPKEKTKQIVVNPQKKKEEPDKVVGKGEKGFKKALSKQIDKEEENG